MCLRYLLFSFFLIAAQNLFAQQKGFYLNPSINGNTVVFRAEGDLWKYDMASGTTIRLTSNQGPETRPAISPDGKQVAFLAQFDGVAEVYTMSINGGLPKRVTYDFGRGYIDLVGWTKDGKIIYSTSLYSSLPSVQLVKLDPVTLDREIIPLAQAAEGCYGDSGELYFTRLPNQGSKTKRYKGGEIEQIWKFDGENEAINLTGDFDGTSKNPMFYEGRIYFISDRDGTMNIWSMNALGKDLKQHSFSKGWDIKTASISGSTIAYQKAADIWIYDIKTNQEKLLDIYLVSDFDQRKPRWIKSPVNTITDAGISTTGNYIALISRGRLFVSPAKSDRWLEISRKSGIRFRDVEFLDEKTLLVTSDETGEYELWTMAADGSGKSRQITKNSKNQIASFSPSPDGKYVAYNDKNNAIHIVETATGIEKFSYTEAYSGTDGLGWSPNSRYMNFTRGLDNLTSQICIVDTKSMKMTPVTTKRLESSTPAWTSDNRWFYFISQRNLQTKVGDPWGPRQPEPYYNETSLIFAMPLDTALNFPFLQTDSWLTDSVYYPELKKKEPAKAPDKKGKGKSKNLTIDSTVNWEQFSRILYTVPVKGGNLKSLDISKDGYLYWINTDADGDDSKAKMYSLKIAESKKYEPTEIASGVSSYSMSADKKKLMIYLSNKTILVADANGQKADSDKTKLQLENWTFQVNPPQDWKQIFDDAWRMDRDYFYDRDMHKVDWVAVRAHYETLLDRVTDRDELNTLIGDMVGELSALHTFVGGGDRRRSAENIQTGFLGASLKTTKRVFALNIFLKVIPIFRKRLRP